MSKIKSLQFGQHTLCIRKHLRLNHNAFLLNALQHLYQIFLHLLLHSLSKKSFYFFAVTKPGQLLLPLVYDFFLHSVLNCCVYSCLQRVQVDFFLSQNVRKRSHLFVSQNNLVTVLVTCFNLLVQFLLIACSLSCYSRCGVQTEFLPSLLFLVSYSNNILVKLLLEIFLRLYLVSHLQLFVVTALSNTVLLLNLNQAVRFKVLKELHNICVYMIRRLR